MTSMATSLNQDDYLKTALRLPRDLHAKIQEAASASGRSMNAEIVARIEDSFEAAQTGAITSLVLRIEGQLAEVEVNLAIEKTRTAGFATLVNNLLEMIDAETLAQRPEIPAVVESLLDGIDDKRSIDDFQQDAERGLQRLRDIRERLTEERDELLKRREVLLIRVAELESARQAKHKKSSRKLDTN